MAQQPTSFNLAELKIRIENAERDAARQCGLSDVLYESRVQDAYADILAAAPADHRVETEDTLRSRGFNPNFAPFIAGPGECRLTGIDTDYCPCGQHE